MKKIVLATLNARYTHSAIGLRYLLANMAEFQSDTEIREFEIKENISGIAEKILDARPVIIGLGVYIWNAGQMKDLVDLIKLVSPGTVIVLGGPEVSHAPVRVDFSQADFIIQGEAESIFYELCRSILGHGRPAGRILPGKPADLAKIKLPYEFYTAEDIQNRVIYVEASRGCPYRCEFCLSSIDKAVRYFDPLLLLEEFEKLWLRGVRKFKFVDRTFNLNFAVTDRILDFFLAKSPPYLAHFEVVPEHFPDSFKEKIRRFPPAALQLEIGVQTLDPEIAAHINRPLNIDKIKENLYFLQTETNAHLHVDLIAGLPGESLAGFAANLNTLAGLTDAEIQIGILKKLSGTGISRHDTQFGMIYSPKPPYEILQNHLISFPEMQKIKRFARFWDMIYNTGNFRQTVRSLWINQTVYDGFSRFSDWLYSATQSTWQFSLDRLAELLFNYLTEVLGLERKSVAELLVNDLLKIEGRRLPAFLKEYSFLNKNTQKINLELINKRQLKHLD